MIEIQFTVQPCWLGRALVAATSQGVCAIALGDSDKALLAELKRNFSTAIFIQGDSEFEQSIQPVLDFIKTPETTIPFALDMQGTDFQQEVWRALLVIAPGETITYTELTQRMGKSKTSVRAVANACGKNRIAIAIPCHRVVGSDGSLRGYRWGEERKRRLLMREKQEVSDTQQLRLPIL